MGEATQRTRRRADGIIETTVEGRVLTEHVEAWKRDFNLLGGSAVWLFLAEKATGYDTAAVDSAAEGFKEAQKRGLNLIVAIITSRMVRMGARLVAMFSKIDMQIVETRAAAEAAIQKARRK